MAVAYDIKAHPTVYGARQYRSRLEAKWASFFDLCGWQFEYEPFDLEGWSPDFLLTGVWKVLVEVKPINAMDEDVTAKMERAATTAGWDGELLLLGVAPLFDMGNGPYESPAVGWLAEPFTLNGAPRIGWGRACAFRPPGLAADFMHDELSWYGRMSGCRFKGEGADWPHTSGWLKSAWDRAANRVQWNKP